MVFYVKVVLGCLEFSVQSQRYVCSDMYAPICLYLLLSRGNQTPVDITSLSELKPHLHHRSFSKTWCLFSQSWYHWKALD